MIELLKTKPDRNGNVKKLRIDHKQKTFESGYFISTFNDFEIITTAERIGEYKRTLKNNNYKEV